MPNEILNRKIAILGSGIVGLSTAFRLLELNEHAQIDIISEKSLQETTSDGAGGLFRPDHAEIPGVPYDLLKKWSKDSFDFYHKLVFHPEASKMGVYRTSGYVLFNEDREDEPLYKEVVYNFTHLGDKELDEFPQRYKYGYFLTTMGFETRIYMSYLTEHLKEKGVNFVSRKLITQAEFVDESGEDYDIVFNCLGLGARWFCNDELLNPLRGQMIRVKAPWVNHFYYTGHDCYIIPNVNTVCLGTTAQLGNYSTEIDPKDREGVLERCKLICPSLEHAQIEWDWAGLRPLRTPIRVEKELLISQTGKQIIMIHNYGHGGNGIALSRGSCVHAIELLMNN